MKIAIAIAVAACLVLAVSATSKFDVAARQADAKQLVNFYKNSHGLAVNHHRNKLNVAEQHIAGISSDKFRAHVAAGQRKALGGPTPCIAAFTELNDFINGADCTDALDIFDRDFNNEGEVETAVTAYCGGNNCAGRLLNKLEDVRDNCTRLELQNNDDFRDFLEILRLPCYQHQGTYCYPKLWTAFVTMALLDNDTITADSTVMDNLCNICVRRMLVQLSAFMDDEDSDNVFNMDLLCMRGGNPPHYCALDLVALDNLPDDGGIESAIDGIEIICGSRCFIRFIERVVERGLANDEFPDGVPNYRAHCIRDQDDNICLVQVFENIELVQSLGDNCVDFASCDGACRQNMQDIGDTLGCCLKSFVALDPNANEEDIENFDTFNDDICDLPHLSGCVAAKGVDVTFVVDNINPDMSPAEREALREAIIADIMQLAQSGDVEVTVELAIGSDGQATITVHCYYESTKFAEDGGAIAKSDVEEDAVVIPDVGSTSMETRDDPIAEVTVNNAATTVTIVDEPPETAAAGAIAPALVAVVAVIAALAL